VTTFTLRFPPQEIPFWAGRYSYPNEEHLELVVAPCAKRAFRLTKDDFLALAKWKSPRSYPLCEANHEDFVQEVTRTALATTNDEFRIKSLTVLRGVGWPMASVILHFVHVDDYPILDYRALESLGVDAPQTYDYPFWRAFTEYTRDIAQQSGVSMRVLDRALWQFSKEHTVG
jgi:thermostable 8-oxoguanine DNA glycosylase